MSLLDLVGGILGQQQQRAGAPSSGMAQVLTQLVAGQGYGQSQGGGLAGLVDRFRQASLGHVADSWVSTRPNQQVSPEQLQRVFPEEQVETMARDSGMPTDSFLSQLSEHLPRVVDGITPNGQLPDEGTVSV
jgi:uncharacterized protein YidB (DUF937 family)